MKYSILRVKSLPYLFKHCSTMQLLHVDLENQGIPEDPAFVQAYLDYIREQIYSSIEADHVTAQASKVTSLGDTFVIFKTNLDNNIMLHALHALFAELSEYCDGNIAISYQFLKGTIYVDGKAASLFRTNEVSDNIQDSDEYKANTFQYDGKAKPRSKHLLSMEQYHTIYNKIPNITNATPMVQKNAEPSAINDLDCEYYI